MSSSSAVERFFLVLVACWLALMLAPGLEASDGGPNELGCTLVLLLMFGGMFGFVLVALCTGMGRLER